jgi:hypothetical protein
MENRTPERNLRSGEFVSPDFFNKAQLNMPLTFTKNKTQFLGDFKFRLKTPPIDYSNLSLYQFFEKDKRAELYKIADKTMITSSPLIFLKQQLASLTHMQDSLDCHFLKGMSTYSYYNYIHSMRSGIQHCYRNISQAVSSKHRIILEGLRKEKIKENEEARERWKRGEDSEETQHTIIVSGYLMDVISRAICFCGEEEDLVNQV